MTGCCGIALHKFKLLGEDDQGAALVSTLALFMLMFLSCVSVFAISTAIRERIHLQNACDAAAYSAAIVQADTLSRVAAINRAMSWTYVQMSRRQMDYIVLRWLKRTCQHYDVDTAGLVPHNRGGPFSPCPTHGSFGVGYYIGANGSPATARQVQLNGLGTSLLPLPMIGNWLNIGSCWDVSTIKSFLNLAELDIVGERIEQGDLLNELNFPLQFASDAATIFQLADLTSLSDAETVGDTVSRLRSNPNVVPMGVSGLDVLKRRILTDRLNIAAMNICSRRLVRRLPEQVKECVGEVLLGNVPSDIVKQCRFCIRQNENPLEGEEIYDPSDTLESGYFCNLYNNADCERRFLSFSGYDEPPVQVFKKTSLGQWSLDLVAGGFDQWYVRGNGRHRTDGGRGLQRSYKHWSSDERGPLWDRHATYNPEIPSCWNLVKLHKSPPSIGLYSEWQWWSDCWACPYVRIPFRGKVYIAHIPWPKDSLLGPFKERCNFASSPSIDYFGLRYLDVLDSYLKSIPYVAEFYSGALSGVKSGIDRDGTVAVPVGSALPDPSNGSGSCPINSYKEGCAFTLDLASLASGALPAIPSCPRAYKALPLTAYARLYGDDPRIYDEWCYVGERTKPLILRKSYFGKKGTISVGVARKNENVWMRVLGMVEGIFHAFDPFVEWTWVFASAKAGYKDPDRPEGAAYIVDWRGDTGADGSYWNLCQDDWDAVFVPVRQAESFAAGVWTPDDKNFLRNWVSNKSDWLPVNKVSAPEVSEWADVRAPPQMLTDSGRQEPLNWEKLTDVMYH